MRWRWRLNGRGRNLTPEQHNKYLAWAHLAHGGMILFFMLMFAGMFGLMSFGLEAPPGKPSPEPFLLIMAVFFGIFYGAFAIPSLVAAYALLKRKRWAKIATIVAGVVGGMFFPTGTAVCVYTFWFLFSEPGKLLYDTPATPRSSLFASSQEPINQHEFQGDSSVPPPDWR